MRDCWKKIVKPARRSTVGLLRWALFESGLLVHHAQQSKRSAVLMFHGIPKESGEEFHDLLRHLSKQFAVVPMETVLDRIGGSRNSKSMIITLTFDDGLRNHRTVVYPLLADLHIPATFYVCPGLIERAVTTWAWETWCRIPWLPKATRRGLCALASNSNSADGAVILEWMKTIPLDKRKQVEESIRLQTPEFEFTAAQLELYELMRWEDMAQLDPGLINIGSHTMTHCDLPILAPSELADELEGSRAALERRLGRPAHDFCYPDGAYNDSVVQAVANVYRSGVTTVCGGVAPGDPPHALKRIAANPDLRWVSWMLATHTGPVHRC
jgi:peptidoglycan/xylan/chitin deacetylase (PgdA/CDA1 family)